MSGVPDGWTGIPDEWPSEDAVWLGPDPGDDSIPTGRTIAFDRDGNRHEFESAEEFARFNRREVN